MKLAIKQSQQEILIDEFAKKIRLERTFLPQVRSVFALMIRDFRDSVAAIGKAPNSTTYQSQWEGILQKHYQRVQQAFRGEVAEANGGKSFVAMLVKQGEEAEAMALLSLALIEWRANMAPSKARAISRTNDKQMQQAIDQARADLQARGEDITPESLSRVATVILTRKFAARSNVIAQTETQESSEATKQMEAQVLAGAVPFALVGTIVFNPIERRSVQKMWKDMDDSRVRQTHMRADGTVLPEGGVYRVGGSSLRFPGDSSLGADIKETINCRCSNIFTFE